MGGIQLRKDLDLLLNILYLIFCTFQIDYLNGNGLLRPLIIAVSPDGVEWSIIGVRQRDDKPTLCRLLRKILCLEVILY